MGVDILHTKIDRKTRADIPKLMLIK